MFVESGRAVEQLSSGKRRASEGAFSDSLHVTDEMTIGLRSPRSLRVRTVFGWALGLALISTHAMADITGSVFRDMNGNGANDATVDQNLPGIVVNAYDASGAPVGNSPQTTDAAGDYTLTGITGDVRIEFTLPTDGTLDYLESTVAGLSAVQFASDGDIIVAGFHYANDYCSSDPDVAAVCYVSGDPLVDTAATGEPADVETIVTIPYSASGTAASTMPDKLSDGLESGSVWGVAYQRSTDTLFSSAFMKRHVGFGNLDIGGIYRVNDATTAPSTQPFVDVTTIGIPMVNPAGTNAARGLTADPDATQADAGAFDAVGTAGIGDIDIADDGDTLWMVNLSNGTLYSIAIDADGDINTPPVAADVADFLIPDPGCKGGEFRPFALNVHQGKVYVGGVCDASVSQDEVDLEAWVYAFDGVTFNPVLTYSLDHPKGSATVGATTPCTPHSEQWYPWSSYSDDMTCGRKNVAHPVPMLSDIEFARDGSMLLGFSDRSSHQFQTRNLDPTGTLMKAFFGSGDTVKACGTAELGWVVESNGTCGGITTAGAGSGEGVGGGEFYLGDRWVNGAPGGRILHNEKTLGALAVLPSTDQVLSSAYDPRNGRGLTSRGGIIWLNNTSGDQDNAFELYSDVDPGNFGKGAGIGDLELLCEPAPIQIGNRVWIDTDGDGIQDPGESPLAGIIVELYDTDGTTLLGTAVTDANGEYYFSNETARASGGAHDIVGIAGIEASTSGYVISIDPNQPQLAVYMLTSADQDPSPGGDTRDSDGTLVSGSIIKSFGTGLDGANDHTFDFGFIPVEYDLALIKRLSAGQSPWVVTGSIVNYDVVIQNQGNVPSQTFTVVDTIPVGMTYVTSSGTGMVCTHDGAATGGQATCVYTPPTPADLAPGATMILNLQLEVGDMTQATYANWAEITGDSSANYGVTDDDSTPDSHGASDGGPGTGTSGGDPVVDHDDIDHDSPGYDDASEDEDDSDLALLQVASSTPITLQSFVATDGGSSTQIRFTTSMEEANVGFNVYGRIRKEWRRLNGEMILAKSNGDSGAEYELTVNAGIATEFALTDIDIFGKETPHGPFEMNRQFGFDPATSTPQVRRAVSAGGEDAEGGAADGADGTQITIADDAAYLVVKRRGIHRVSFEQLVAAGIDLSDVPAASLAVSFMDEPLPIFVSDSKGRAVETGRFTRGQRIEFFAEVGETETRKKAVYMLHGRESEALRAATANPRAERYAKAGWKSVRWAPNNIYQRVSPLSDAWYARRLTSLATPATETVMLDLADLSASKVAKASLRVVVWGANDEPTVDREHRVLVKVNGRRVGRKSFGGIGGQVIDVTVPAGVLTRGRNQVDVTAVNRGGATVSAVALESVELTYRSRTVLDGSHGEFLGTSPGYSVTGLESRDAVVWRIEDGVHTRIRPLMRRAPKVPGRSKTFKAKFAGSDQPGTVHAIAAGNGIATPVVKRAAGMSDLVSGPAEYLVITHPRFIGGWLDNLANARRADGLSVKIVNVNSIYRANSSGNVDAQAIRDYIAWAHANLETESVLLVGGDTYDTKGFLRGAQRGTARSLMPTIYGPSADGVNHAPADPLFGDVDGDGVPEVAIGRFPVQTVPELRAMVEKTMQYAQADYGQRAVFMTDDVDDGSRRSFASDARRLIQKMPQGWKTKLHAIEQIGAKKARKRLMRHVGKGVALTSWIGHSDKNVWSFDRALRRSDVQSIENQGRPTVVMQFGCWNSYFVDPKRETMAHYWLLSPDQGAAAVMGASTLTDAVVEVLLAEELNKAMMDEGLPLGLALVKAKRALAAQYPADKVRDVIAGYLLLGDPGLKLPAVGN